MTIQELFALGMKRDVPELIPFGSTVVNLGAGTSPLAGAINLDLPEWDADTQGLEWLANDSINTISAFHFFEHLSGDRVVMLLRECERVLMVGGTLNIVVPHRLGVMAYQDLDHQTFFTEETWRILFSNPYYSHNRCAPWHFRVHVNVIIGVVERNLALMTQLVKEA